MRTKTLEINLADLDEKSLIDLLNENNADAAELLGLLDSLFHMWAVSLRFAATVVQYGEERHDDFMEVFVKNAASQHGVSPKRLAHILKLLEKSHPAPQQLH